MEDIEVNLVNNKTSGIDDLRVKWSPLKLFSNSSPYGVSYIEFFLSIVFFNYYFSKKI